MDISTEAAERLLAQEAPELYEALNHVDFDFPSSLGVREDGTDADARLKLTGIWVIYKSRVCKSEAVKVFFEDPKKERRAVLVCAIADLLAFSGAMTVAALLVKEGLIQSCESEWR